MWGMESTLCRVSIFTASELHQRSHITSLCLQGEEESTELCPYEGKEMQVAETVKDFQLDKKQISCSPSADCSLHLFCGGYEQLHWQSLKDGPVTSSWLSCADTHRHARHESLSVCQYVHAFYCTLHICQSVLCNWQWGPAQ